MGAGKNCPSLVGQLKEFIRVRDAKPGNVYLGVVSRLDAFVSGVIVFAKTSKAAARLTRQFQQSTVSKTYLAIIVGRLANDAGQTLSNGLLRDYVRKNDALRRMEAFTKPVPGSTLAELKYRVVASEGQSTLIEIDLLTGRKHQIRVQLAERGCPIFGDRKYGSRESMGNQIALHSYRLSLEHPTRKEMLTFSAPIPPSWKKYRRISRLLKGI